MSTPKTVGSRIVESMIGSVLQGVVDNAAQADPLPPMSAPGEPITFRSILEQIELKLETEPRSAMRLSLVLGAWLARRQGLGDKDALMHAAIAWTQTTNLTGG